MRRVRAIALPLLLALSAGALGAAPAAARTTRLSVPNRARQLIVVSSRTRGPSDHLASLRAYERRNAHSPWHRVMGAWQAEIGTRLLPAARRREADHTTPIGVFGFGRTMYGNAQRPRGLHYHYRHLRCGDWWDEDPFTHNYNRHVHVPCGLTPGFASWSEALWTETRAYPEFAVIRFNMGPIKRGRRAPGSAIFLHSWVGGATQGCVAVHPRKLLRLLRWLRPARHPMIEIGTTAQVQPYPGPL